MINRLIESFIINLFVSVRRSRENESLPRRRQVKIKEKQ